MSVDGQRDYISTLLISGTILISLLLARRTRLPEG
jgi:hypothetical protein